MVLLWTELRKLEYQLRLNKIYFDGILKKYMQEEYGKGDQCSHRANTT